MCVCVCVMVRVCVMVCTRAYVCVCLVIFQVKRIIMLFFGLVYTSTRNFICLRGSSSVELVNMTYPYIAIRIFFYIYDDENL